MNNANVINISGLSTKEIEKLKSDILDYLQKHPIPIGYLNGKPVYEIGKDTADKDFVPTIFN